jgi:predicted small lipoprotein YifL
MLRQFRLAAVLAATLACAGCGIKGPLVLPPPAAANPAPAAPPSAAPPSAAPPSAATPGASETPPATRKQ